MTGQPEIEVSVVVATRNREGGCLRLIQALSAQFGRQPEVSYELVLVFDGCAVYPWVAAYGDQLRIVELPERQGIARTRNAGIAATTGLLVAFLDDDCVPSERWLADLVRMSRTYPRHVAFGGRVIGTDPVNLYAQLRDEVYYREVFGPWYRDYDAGGDLVGAPYVNGGNSAYRRGVLLEAGGFDETLPAYSDVELGRRLDLASRAVLGPGMAIHHDHPAGFRPYMLRCWRSGSARALLWARRGYRQDRPGRVVRTILLNIVWNNAASRRRRVNAPFIRVVWNLLCQEVVHGMGYAHAFVTAGVRCGRKPRGSAGAATRLGDTPDSP